MTTPEQDHSLSQDQSRLVRQLRVALWTTVGIAIVLVLSLIGVVIWLAVVNANEISNTNRQIAVNQQASDRRWCATFDLLTAVPVPAPADPAANPSREANYQLYADFVALETQFGCRKLRPGTPEKPDQVGQGDNADHNDENPRLFARHGSKIPVDTTSNRRPAMALPRILSPSTDPTGWMAAAGAVVAAAVMITNEVNGHGVIDTTVIVSAVGAVLALFTRTAVTPTSDPVNSAGQPLAPAAEVPPVPQPLPPGTYTTGMAQVTVSGSK